MLDDARRIPNGTRVEADICVVGSGPAGLSLALELMGSGHRLCLLEAGGERPDRATQSLFDGETSFYPENELQESRLACLGGTTRVWSGWCRPLDAAAFEPPSWVEEDGWPFGREELDPFYERAQALCGLGSFDDDVSRWRSEAAKPLLLPADLIETRLFQMSPPTRFGREYRRAVRDAPDVRVLLRAVCTELVPDAAGRIASLRAATLAGGAFEVTARFYVLAAGGIENPRLLLLSDGARPGGLGNEHDLVGRYYMDHSYVTAGRLSLQGPAVRRETFDESRFPLSFYYPHRSTSNGGWATVRGVFTPPRSRVEAERLLTAVLFPLPPWESAAPLGSEGAAALRALAQSVRRGWFPDDGWSKVREALRDPTGTLGALYHRLVRPGLGEQRPRSIRIRAFCEALPSRSHRVELIAARDRLGRRKVRVDWSPSEREREGLTRGYELLGRALEQAGIGQLECTLGSDEEDQIEGGRHHMGTTRMHADFASGVVDPNCRVYGIENLFIAGSSVFPTAGFANPTLTIVALSLRLADHLRSLLARDA